MDRDLPDYRPFSIAAVSTRADEAPARRPRLHLAGEPRRPGEPRKPVETVPLQAILKGAREAIIDFNGAAYRLRITRNHRLILTK